MKHIKTFESFVNEASVSVGPKAKKFADMIDGATNTFAEAVKNEKEEDGNLPEEYFAALKTLGIKEDEAMVCFTAEFGDYNQVIEFAKKAGLKFFEVEDSETGDRNLVYSSKQ